MKKIFLLFNILNFKGKLYTVFSITFGVLLCYFITYICFIANPIPIEKTSDIIILIIFFPIYLLCNFILISLSWYCCFNKKTMTNFRKK